MGETKKQSEKMETGGSLGKMEKTNEGQAEEPKVKQVTFQQEEDHIAEASQKKPRKRLKGVIKQLKDQVRCLHTQDSLNIRIIYIIIITKIVRILEPRKCVHLKCFTKK